MANLPVPTLASEVPGNFLTAALWTSSVYNSQTFLLNKPIFVGTQTVTQNILNTTWVTISLDTEQVDTYGGHSTVSNTSRYVAQVSGYYDVCGVVVASANATGVRAARISINGVGNPVQGAACMVPSAGSSSFTGVATPTRTVFLNTNDYVEVAMWQNSGVASPGLATGVASDLASALWVAFSHA